MRVKELKKKEITTIKQHKKKNMPNFKKSEGYKMKGFQAHDLSPLLKNNSFSPIKAPIIGKRVVNEDGSVSRTFTNPFTGRSSTRTVTRGKGAAETHNMGAANKQSGKSSTYSENITNSKDVAWEHKDKSGKTIRKTMKHKDKGASGKTYINKWGTKRSGEKFDKYKTRDKENVFTKMRSKTGHEGTIHSKQSKKYMVDRDGKPVEKAAYVKQGEGLGAKTINKTNKTSKTYTIKSGDRLGDIAKANNTTVENIMKNNPSIKDKNKIRSGGTLNL